MKDYTYFSPSVMEFKDGNSVYDAPPFVERAKSNYRFDHKRKVLQKKCTQCKKYFDVQEFNQGKFTDNHDEEKIHYISGNSGYATRCKVCESEYSKMKEDQELKVIMKEKETVNLKLTEENWMFIRVISAYKYVSEDVFINEVLDSVRKHNKFKIEYEELIK